MITIISGTPGAGKTLYTIEKLLLPLVGKKIVGQDTEGNSVEISRTIYTNINGLQVEHELIDGGENQGLRDWHKWAKPGSVIVFDEVQKIWPPRANGAKVPDDIQALDTHRHMGVDFILITQNVMNIDRHIHALGGRHLHVRRIANMPLAVVYEWDHVSRGLMFSKAVTKSPWRYDKKVFKLYKSAELHTKQPRRMPGLVWFILLGLVAIAFLAPYFKNRMTERFNTAEKSATAAPKPSTQPNTSAKTSEPAVAPSSSVSAPYDEKAFVPRVLSKPESAPAYDDLRRVVNMPRVAGGICTPKKCLCVTQQGSIAGLSDAECRSWITSPPFDPYTVAAAPVPAPVRTAPPPAQSEPAPLNRGVINPKAQQRDELAPPVLPPGSPVHPVLPGTSATRRAAAGIV